MNTRSVKTVTSKVNKLADLQTLVSLTDCDILCITETWLNDRVANVEILPDSFNIFIFVIVIMRRQVGVFYLEQRKMNRVALK